MAESVGRVQDQGRRHRKSGAPSAATRSLLATAQQAMRDELAGLLRELEGTPPAPGLLDAPGDPPAPVRPPLRDRAAYWSLAIQLMRELGTEVDVGDPEDVPTPRAARARRRRPDFGPDR